MSKPVSPRGRVAGLWSRRDAPVSPAEVDPAVDLLYLAGEVVVHVHLVVHYQLVVLHPALGVGAVLPHHVLHELHHKHKHGRTNVNTFIPSYYVNKHKTYDNSGLIRAYFSAF